MGRNGKAREGGLVMLGMVQNRDKREGRGGPNI